MERNSINSSVHTAGQLTDLSDFTTIITVTTTLDQGPPFSYRKPATLLTLRGKPRSPTNPARCDVPLSRRVRCRQTSARC
ncbi:MAG: hypothetical protein HC893_10995 [Chloroflexaceae bacterium]|nr:hypothetical protein [Chloroflexaceae bacterium]